MSCSNGGSKAQSAHPTSAVCGGLIDLSTLVALNPLGLAAAAQPTTTSSLAIAGLPQGTPGLQLPFGMADILAARAQRQLQQQIQDEDVLRLQLLQQQADQQEKAKLLQEIQRQREHTRSLLQSLEHQRSNPLFHAERSEGHALFQRALGRERHQQTMFGQRQAAFSSAGEHARYASRLPPQSSTLNAVLAPPSDENSGNSSLLQQLRRQQHVQQHEATLLGYSRRQETCRPGMSREILLRQLAMKRQQQQFQLREQHAQLGSTSRGDATTDFLGQLQASRGNKPCSVSSSNLRMI